VFNVRLARLVMMDDAMAPAEARILAATRETTADPLETLDLIETILVYKFPQLSREDIRAMLHLPVTELERPASTKRCSAKAARKAASRPRAPSSCACSITGAVP